MKCPNCNVEIPEGMGLVPLDKDVVVTEWNKVYGNTKQPVWTVIEFICSKFGAAKEKVELDRDELIGTLLTCRPPFVNEKGDISLDIIADNIIAKFAK